MMDTRNDETTRDGTSLVLNTSDKFRDKLRQIRADNEALGAEHRVVRADHGLKKSQKILDSFDYLESIEAVIRRYVHDFMDEAHDFDMSRSFYEGKYLIAIRANEAVSDELGRKGETFSRLTFLLEPKVDEGEFHLEVRRTARGNDAQTAHVSGHMTDEDRERFTAFIEEQCVAFATAYFDRERTKPLF